MHKRLLLCASLALAGCSSAPSDGDIENFLLLELSSCKNIKLVDVTKTNGYEKDGDYHVEFSYGIKYDAASELHRAYLEDKERDAQSSKESEIYYPKKKQLEVEIFKLDSEFSKSTPSPYSQTSNQSSAEREAEKTAMEEWYKRRAENSKQQRTELEGLEKAWEQRLSESKSNGVLGREGNFIYTFNLAGCGRGAYRYVPVSFPEKDEAALTGDMSYMFMAHETQMKGSLAMRKTENGWRAISQN